jgi:hypothetical protein
MGGHHRLEGGISEIDAHGAKPTVGDEARARPGRTLDLAELPSFARVATLRRPSWPLLGPIGHAFERMSDPDIARFDPISLREARSVGYHR